MYEELVTALRQLQDWDAMDFDDETGYAREIIGEAADAIEELSKRVPLVLHGRLIDADKLIALWERDRNRVFYADHFIFTIEHAPTVIEAEEETE